MTRSRVGGARRWILAVLLLGLAGSAAELLLLEHYENGWQMLPIALIVAAVGLLAWEIFSPSPISVRLFRATMMLFVVAGFVGIALHMRGAAEFQREMDPEMERWTMLTKVLRAKAPPALAPGLMIQLGLLGLTFTFIQEKQT